MSSIRILLATLGLLLLPTSLIAQEFTLGFEISSSLGSVGGGIQNLTFGQVQGASDGFVFGEDAYSCLLYTSPSPRDANESRMPSSA